MQNKTKQLLMLFTLVISFSGITQTGYKSATSYFVAGALGGTVALAGYKSKVHKTLEEKYSTFKKFVEPKSTKKNILKITATVVSLVILSKFIKNKLSNPYDKVPLCF